MKAGKLMNRMGTPRSSCGPLITNLIINNSKEPTVNDLSQNQILNLCKQVGDVLIHRFRALVIFATG